LLVNLFDFEFKPGLYHMCLGKQFLEK